MNKSLRGRGPVGLGTGRAPVSEGVCRVAPLKEGTLLSRAHSGNTRAAGRMLEERCIGKRLRMLEGK
ncbi:hypothetical protein CesoFtcFv8_025662 [Champsocephalus esox]|uniref:Uncharacterized protein n=1 Tax=Champsocephalus esox TaxID=159716 RepID=A0AAN8B0T9_9TELE|nr:hypothetical protein CesoFtcFv8_025662 [Champsocephalus esox]